MEMYLFAPSASLGPERLWNYEISLMQQLGRVGIFNASVFMIEGSNLIVRGPNPDPGPPPMIRTNSGSFSNWGIELESNFRPVKALSVDLNYSYLNADTRLYFAPKHQFYAGAMYQVAGFKLSANMKSVGGLYTFIDQEFPENDLQESYLLMDAKVSYQVLKELQVYIAGKNLLNSSYQTYLGYPMPGISMLAGISVQIN